MSDTTVYTIFAGMLPTLGFDKRDFATDRAGKVSKTAVRGSKLGLRGVIGYDGSLRKARINGSVAWYEYSTTVKAIHQEVMGGSKEVNPEELGRQKGTFESKYATNRSKLLNDFISKMGDTIIPTNKEVTGKPGTPSEQAIGSWEHPDDPTLRKQGNLVGKANAIDLYFRGKDGKIYRIDVTSMTMDDKRAHHGLTSFADREAKGVDSESLLDLMGEQGGIKKAQDRLLKYFEGAQEGWNDVIKRLKTHIASTDKNARNYLNQLKSGSKSLNDKDVVDGFRGSLKKGTGKDFFSKIRPAKKQAITNLRNSASNRLGTGAKAEAFQSAVSFALHSIGNILNIFRNDSAVKGGYSTEIRLGGAATNWTIEVKHQVHASGANVLEFMKLKEGDVLLHNEAALQHVYMRTLGWQDRKYQKAILDETSRQQNEMHAAYAINKGEAAITIGGAVDTVISGLASDGNAVYHKARAVITPKDFNEKIETWIKTVGTGHGWKEKVGTFLKTHIREGDTISGYDRIVPSYRTMNSGKDANWRMTERLTEKGGTKTMWGLKDYLANTQQEGFEDSVSPKWWAAPYISLLYPSGQVGSATK